MPSVDVDAVVAELLSGLDEDTLEYIKSAVLDGNDVLPRDELVEFLVPLVQEELCGDDEAKATALAGTLHDRLAPETNSKPKAAPKAKRAPGEAFAQPLASMLGGYGAEAAAEETKAAASKKPSAAPKVDLKAAKASQKRAEEVERQSAELDKELECAREKAVRLRAKMGSFNGAIEIGPLTLPNPGGGLDLLEDASFTMTPGRRYALIGRNGKGKSTLLRYLAARRVGGMPESVTVHYVSQEVAFSAAAMDALPAEAVLEADVQRRLLLEELKALDGKAEKEAQERHQAGVSGHWPGRGTIRDGVLTWEYSGDVVDVTCCDASVICMIVRGRELKGVILPTGDIMWDDGDSWSTVANDSQALVIPTYEHDSSLSNCFCWTTILSKIARKGSR